MALSVFERVVVRLRVLVGFTCSFASGVSDVLLMKKTPFYLRIRHFGDGNLSSQPQKRTVIFPFGKRQTLSLVQCQALYSSALSGVVAMFNRS